MAQVTEHFDITPEFCEKYCYGKAWPLPRTSKYEPHRDRFDVIIAGAGPAGLFLTLLLNRYGLNQGSVLCVDPKPRHTDVGHADGIHARTVEIMATLGLESGIVREGRRFSERAGWACGPEGIIKQSKSPFFFAPSRFGDLFGFHQGRFERVLSQDLARYTTCGVQYSSAIEDVSIDETDPDFPVRARVRFNGQVKEVRSKYLIGADGAHSTVRKCVNVPMEGDIVDEIWGVIDFVPDSDFPDVRRPTLLMADEKTMVSFMIPREKLSNGDYLIRIYINMTPERAGENAIVAEERRNEIQQRREAITKETILAKIGTLWKPFRITLKSGTRPVWWATYSVGQRLAQRFIINDAHKHPRVFLAGDACHTHSPRQGQGLNISCYDAYALSWRLAYVLMGLAQDDIELLRSYESERRLWAQRVVFADKRWNQGHMPMTEVLQEMRQQVTGCGIEEPVGLLISDRNDAVAWKDTDLLSGALHTGRRLFNVVVTRWADGTIKDIHDDFVSDGRYRILVLAANDFPNGRSRTAAERACGVVDTFVEGTVEVVVLQPWTDDHFQWKNVPPVLKQQAEMRLHTAGDTVYDTYRIKRDRGALALIRPDGIVAITTELEDIGYLEEMLHRVLKIKT